ncbi:MAG: hypothetical protein R3252_09070 [Robiginitalea sp.]|nr:hypothetical protein [Robiginitalea sp.]
MTRKRLITQAMVGGVFYFIISLILERSTASEVLITEGTEALIFAVVYGIGLWIYHRFIKKSG